MLAGSLFLLIAFGQASGSPKPPKSTYDAKRDVTKYSTGDVRTAGYSGYGVRFEFPGKTFSVPETIDMGFGALRVAHGDDTSHDGELAHWNGVDTVTITFGKQTATFHATHEFKLSSNRTVSLLLGRAYEESLSITITPAWLKQLATADSLQVQLGKDRQEIKSQSLGPLKQLAATLP